MNDDSKFLNMCGTLDHQASQYKLAEIEAIILIIQGKTNTLE